jgi:hypothetical protein
MMHRREFRARFDEAFGEKYRRTDAGRADYKRSWLAAQQGKVVILYRQGNVAYVAATETDDVRFELRGKRVVFVQK